MTASKSSYKCFFFLRVLAEGVKIYLILSLWLLRPIFFESIHFDSKSASFYEFLITSTATLLMTASSFVLCVYKMY